MKTLLTSIIICLAVSLNGFAQNTAASTTKTVNNNPLFNDINTIFKFDLAGLATRDIAFEMEKPLNKNKSYNLRTGFKFYQNSGLETGNYNATFTTLNTEDATNFFIFIALDNNSSVFVGDERPLERLDHTFYPTFSIPIDNSIRFYAPNLLKGKFYIETGFLSSITKGLNITEDINSTVLSESTEGTNGGFFEILIGQSTTVQEVLYHQTRSIENKFQYAGGLALSIGTQFRFKESGFIDLQFQGGSNFINGLDHTNDYTTGDIYGKIKLLIGFGM